MNAVANVVQLRQLDRYERASLRTELYRWGKWMQIQAEKTGYPSSDPIAADVYGNGGVISGHRVLMVDMPDDVWKTNSRVVQLNEEWQAAIRTVYINIMTVDGVVMPWEQRAQRAGISLDALRWRHNQALRRIAGLE